MTSEQRKKLIIEKMKANNIDVGCGVLNKYYYNESTEINELIIITSCFSELGNNKNEN